MENAVTFFFLLVAAFEDEMRIKCFVNRFRKKKFILFKPMWVKSEFHPQKEKKKSNNSIVENGNHLSRQIMMVDCSGSRDQYLNVDFSLNESDSYIMLDLSHTNFAFVMNLR